MKNVGSHDNSVKKVLAVHRCVMITALSSAKVKREREREKERETRTKLSQGLLLFST